MDSKRDFLKIIEELMDIGYDENTASREAYALLYPDRYDPADYK